MYLKAAEKGFAPSESALGILYLSGDGVPQDYEKSVEWFRKAAEQGDAHGANGMGHAYFMGQGIERDVRKAAGWFQKAAELGDPIAQANLGHILESGAGASINYVEAYKWYHLSSDQGCADATRAMNELAKIMTPKQMKESLIRMTMWLEQHRKIKADLAFNSSWSLR